MKESILSKSVTSRIAKNCNEFSKTRQS